MAEDAHATRRGVERCGGLTSGSRVGARRGLKGSRITAASPRALSDRPREAGCSTSTFATDHSSSSSGRMTACRRSWRGSGFAGGRRDPVGKSEALARGAPPHESPRFGWSGWGFPSVPPSLFASTRALSVMSESRRGFLFEAAPSEDPRGLPLIAYGSDRIPDAPQRLMGYSAWSRPNCPAGPKWPLPGTKFTSTRIPSGSSNRAE